MESESNYKLLFMSRQALSRDAGKEQLCGESASSVCVPVSGATVLTDSAGGPLGSQSEEQLTISIVISDSSSFPARLGEDMGKSDEESLARSCTWSCSEPHSMLTLLHKPQKLCRVSSRFCSSSVCSRRSRSFSFFNFLISHSSWCILSSFLFRQRCAATRFLLLLRTSWTNSS